MINSNNLITLSFAVLQHLEFAEQALMEWKTPEMPVKDSKYV